MNLLIPLGLLGLLGVVALIIIYIIKPNYQQKRVSSTFVWQLSKKYRKKKIPLNRLRDILLIVCQILIVTACALILSKPSIITGTKNDKPEVVAIIDSSASMLTKNDAGETRFERAVSGASLLVEKTLNAGGVATVIVASESPYYLIQNADSQSLKDAQQVLDDLKTESCGYGVSNIDSALKMSEDAILVNPDVKVYLYTDNDYYSVPDGVILKRDEVIDEIEWNVAVLNAYVEKIDNYYNLTVDVACYSSQPRDIHVQVDISKANYQTEDNPGKDIRLTDNIACKDGATYRITWQSVETNVSNGDEYLRVNNLYDGGGKDERFFNFEEITVTVSGNSTDSFVDDNVFKIYGGRRHELKIMYYSRIGNMAMQNPYVRAVLFSLQERYSDDWSIVITEHRDKTEPPIEGYDYYIFEHTMPATMPTDGFVFLINPDKAPQNSGLTVGKTMEFPNEDGADLTYGSDSNDVSASDILRNVDPTDILVKRYVSVEGDSDYKVLIATTDHQPALMYKDDGVVKVAVLTFSLHYSTLPLNKAFPLLMDNVFNHVFKTSVEKLVYEVNDTVSIDSMSKSATLQGVSDTIEFTTVPASYKVTAVGTYTVTQSLFGKNIKDNFFVHINEKESDIFAINDEAYNPFTVKTEQNFYKDMLLYIAIALVSLLFIEWILKITDNV